MEEEKEEDKELHKHSLQSDEDKSLLDDDASGPVHHGDFYHQQHRHRIRKHRPINDINWKEHDPSIDRSSQGQGYKFQDGCHSPEELTSIRGDVPSNPMLPVPSGDHSLTTHHQPTFRHVQDRHHGDQYTLEHPEEQCSEERSAGAEAKVNERQEKRGIAARGDRHRNSMPTDIRRPQGPSAAARSKPLRCTAPAALQAMELKQKQDLSLVTYTEELRLEYKNEVRQLKMKYNEQLNNFQLMLAAELSEKLREIGQKELQKAKELFGSDDDEGGEFDDETELDILCPRCNCCFYRADGMREKSNGNSSSLHPYNRQPAEHYDSNN